MKKDAKWFIYPVHSSEIWIYHGDDDLWIYTQPDSDGKAYNPSNHNFFKMTPEETRRTKVPQAVLDRSRAVQEETQRLTGRAHHTLYG